MKMRTKTFLLLLFAAMLFFGNRMSSVAQVESPFDDISSRASVFVFRKNLNTPTASAGSQKNARGAAGGGSAQKAKSFERRSVIKVKKSASVAAVSRKEAKPTTLANEPIAPDDWVNEEADLAIEERKIADQEPLLFLSEGYLNSKIQFCESPLFPDDARRARSKQVKQKISVTIGKYGGVLDAQSLEGDPVFRNSIYKSLQSLRFRETYFMGQPVRIQGLLEFTQTPANDVLCRVARKEAEIPAEIEGGIINEYAKTCEVPSFPTEATTAKLDSVTAQVQVIVDEKGSVVYAAPVGGHPAFGLAAATAAKKATFPISSIIRQPVKVRGIMIFKQTRKNDGSCKNIVAE